MSYIATVREDMVTGRGTGIEGVPLPDEFSSLPLDRLRYDGTAVIDGSTVSDWYIDASGAKRLSSGAGRHALTCAWDDVVENHDGTWTVVDGAKAALKSYAASKRAGVINGGCIVTVSGSPLKVWADTQTQTALTALSVIASSTPALTTVWKCRDGTFATLNASGIAALASGVMTFVQSAFATEGDVVSGIDAGTLTTTAEIDAAQWPSN